MNDLSTSRQSEVELALKKIVEDFGHLERAIGSAIADVEACDGMANEIASLERARLAARRGADLARKGIAAD